VSPYVELSFSDWKKAEEKTPVKIVLRIGSQWFSRIIIANMKLSLNRNMGEQYKTEVKYGQNALQRVVSIITVWQNKY
jgi:hypothetical protein